MAQLTQRSDPFRRRRATSDHQYPDRLDITSARLGQPERLTRQRRPGGDHRVDGVGLAFAASHLPVRAIDFDHRDPGPLQLAGQPGPIRAGALHPNQVHAPMGAQPADQLHAAGLGGRERLDAEHSSNAVNDGGNVHIGMRVDTGGHRTCLLYDGHGHPFLAMGSKGWHALAGRVREPGTVGADPEPFPTRPVSAVSQPADGSFAVQPEVSADSWVRPAGRRNRP